MEISANNGHTIASEAGNGGLPDTLQADDSARESELLKNNSSASVTDNMDLDDMRMTVNTKKRAFDEESKSLHSPSKKLAISSSLGAVNSDMVSVLNNLPSKEAMNIDSTQEDDGEGSPGAQEVPGTPLELGNHVNSGVASMGGVDQSTPNLQSTDITSSSVVDSVSSEGDYITPDSADLEVRDMGTINGFCNTLGLLTEVGAKGEKDTLFSRKISTNGHLECEGDQVLLNVTGEERRNVATGIDKSAALVDSLQFSRPIEGESEEMIGGFCVAGAASISTVKVSVPEAQKTPLSTSSYAAKACQVLEESTVADGVRQCKTIGEEVVDGRSEITEVGDLQVGKPDAANGLELKMVEVIMQSSGLEVAESRVVGKRNPSSDFSSSVRKPTTNGVSEEDRLAGLLEPVIHLPEHVKRSNSFFGVTLDVDHQGNGKIKDDLHSLKIHANTQILQSQALEDPRSLQVASNKDDTQRSGGDNADDSMDKQDSEVATPSAATSSQSQSSDLKMRMNLKGAVDIAVKASPSFAVGKTHTMKEVILKEAPASAKLLLASGLLDGHFVRYIGRGGHVMQSGIIKEGGVLCNCSQCKGVKVVNVSAFEKHAGSSARHPSDFIFLENDKCLKDILEIGWSASKHKLNILEKLKSAIGEIQGPTKIGSGDHSTIQNDVLEKKPRLSLDAKPRLAHDAKPRMSLDSKARMSLDSKQRVGSESKVRGSEGRAALPRERMVKEKEAAGSPVPSRETSGANLHKALFLPGGLEDGTELGYHVKGQKYLSGVKKGAGILCGCCSQVISCSLFEQHAGWGSRRNPYTSIYLANGRSLHDAAQSLVVEQTGKRREGITRTKIEHLDQCVECGDTGDLQLCRDCPNAYHLDCLSSVDSSGGEFFCPSCQEQRSGGTKDRRRRNGKRRSEGAPKTLLTKDYVTGRCSRLSQLPPESTTIGGCVFCKSPDFEKEGFGPMTTLLCDQCEREYHVGCLKKHGLEDLKELPEGEWFCGDDCKHIHTILTLLVNNGPEPLLDSIISKALKVRPQFERLDDSSEVGCGGFEWQLLHGRGGDPANGKTLSEAVEIFSECFDPIADGLSGGDLIPLMVHRRSIRDQDFRGIYTVVLKHYNKVVSTALIRVFGRQLAELPLLATSPSHQGQGHCKALLLSIERLLGVLRVERLALAAANGAEDIWLNKFGFTRMSEEQVTRFHTDLNMMVFTGSFMLEKEIEPLDIIHPV